jgi:MFS family permease
MFAQIPPLIRRNTALFALTQSFTGAGMQFAYGFGPLMVMELTGSASLAGLSVGLIGVSRFLVAYPAGKITDTYGRVPGIQLGLVLALVGTLTLFAAMHQQSVWIFIIGLLIFGMGMNASQQLRIAAADMYPPKFRAQALGFVALGSLVGLIIGPIMMRISETIAPRLGQDPLGLPWLMLPILIIGGMGLATLVRPDPKEIGMNLQKYYPDYVPAHKADGSNADRPKTDFSARDLLSNGRMRLAIVSNCAANGNMSIVMVLTSLVLHHHGHSLSAIAFSHMFHSAGMFGFTIPLGRLADRFGRERVMFPGVATTIVGAILLALTSGWWSVTLGTFLVGIGWAAANVAATALIADHAPAEHRGRAIGVNDSFAGATSVFAALVTGPLIDWSGLPATGLTAVLMAAVPFALLTLQRRTATAESRS